MTDIKQILAVANAVDPWDQGASPDGFSDEVAATRHTDAASDFVFNSPSQRSVEPVGQGQPVAATAQPETASAPKRPAPVEHRFRNAEHQRAIAGGYEVAPAPAPDDSSRHPFLERVLKTPSVKAALVAAKAAQKDFRVVCGSTEKIIDSQKQAAKLLAAIDSCTDVVELETLRCEYAETQGPAADAARRSANRIVRHAFTKLDVAVSELLDAATSELDNLVPEIEAAEIAMFDSFGFKHERTPLAGKLAQIKGRVEHHRQSLALGRTPERVNSITPGDCQEILDVFTA